MQPMPTVQAYPNVPDTHRERILIIDDELEIQKVLSELLRDRYRCTAVSSARDALDLLVQQEFNLVISDIMMPGMSGLEMIPRVHELRPDTVIIIISGVQTVESAIDTLRFGAFDYLMKPFDLDHVERAVERGLEHYALREAKRRYEEKLEELVAERTAELVKANESLQQEIDERIRAEERSRYLSDHDMVTDLPNQSVFKVVLERELANAHSNRMSAATIFLALDRFKTINDTLGHDIGALLLQSASRRFVKCVPENGMVAYIGGDEFSLLVTGIERAEDALKIVQEIREVLQEPFRFGDQDLYVTCSFGISIYPGDGGDCQTLMKNASAALFRAEEFGGDNYQFYTGDMNAAAVKRLSLENSLRRALEREEFLVYFQPQIDVTTKKIVGTEALVRWQHPELGLVSPAEFIPLAEDTGLIVPIGEWVLKTACAQTRVWNDSGHPDLRVGINLSARQFQQPNLVAVVSRLIDESGLDPRNVDLELTESAIMNSPDTTNNILREFNEMGITISIDDFGTGYSSLSYLKKFPISMLKIDKSFVNDMATDPDDAALVMAIITLAHNMRMKVIAEGVETKEQLTFLHLLRCDQVQGYLFSKPLTVDAMDLFFREWELKASEWSGGNSR